MSRRKNIAATIAWSKQSPEPDFYPEKGTRIRQSLSALSIFSCYSFYACYMYHIFQATVDIISRATCNSASSYNGIITPEMVCAGILAGGIDTCQVRYGQI
jgi:hypothetical protein